MRSSSVISAEAHMNRKLLPWIASVVGSYVGWWIGERWGFAAGAILSLVGLAVGLHYGRKWVAENL
ncbi:MAG TPA: hypothetical protein VFT29_03460 [Gemmatimonadaceae bacterium]|nr:hypothetical protein [Gemmatimonadaceae bacterium]